MNIKDIVKQKANERYPNNSDVYERINREIKFLDETDSTRIIETFFEIRNTIKENIFLNQASFLTLYLLGFSYVNPMPAHYYNPNTKELIFDESKDYGIDLEGRQGYIRDGFNLNEEHIISLGENIYFFSEIKNVHEDKVTSIIKNNYSIEFSTSRISHGQGIFKLRSEEIIDVLNFKNVSIFFVKDIPKINEIKDTYSLIDVDEFKRCTFGPYFRQNILNEIDSSVVRKAGEKSSFDFNIKTYKEFLYLSSYLETCKDINKNKFTLDLDSMILPTTIEDVYNYLKTQKHSNKEAAQIENNIWNEKKLKFECDNQTIKSYLISINSYSFKSELVQRNIGYYLSVKTEAQKIKNLEDDLFARWKEKYELFVPDGVVDPVSYISSWLKITFVLKEVNAKDSFELMDFLRGGAVGSTWNNIARWSAGTIFSKKYEDVKELNSEDRKEYLSPISVINLKKTPGGARSKYKEIEKYAESDREFINKQLDIYKPDVIVCCGTGRAFQNQILNTKEKDWIKESNDLWYMWYGGRLVINTWHPQQSSKGRTNEYLFRQIPLVLNKIINQTPMFGDDANTQEIF